jgi:CheY-like chemotaxis protein
MTGTASSLQVLVVEDDPDIANVLAITFKLLGYRCHTADCGAAGLAAASSHPPDVAFIDLGLPDMNGVELACRLRVERTSAPLYVVALTGFSKHAHDSVAFDEYLVKPVERATLAKTVARARERRCLLPLRA